MTSQLQIKLGLSNLKLQKTDQAKSAFEQVLLIPNVSAEIETRTHFHLAEIYQANQQLNQAKTKYQLILSTINANTTNLVFRTIRTKSAFQLAYLTEDINLYDQVILANLTSKMTAISLYRQALLLDKNNQNTKSKANLELLVDRFSGTTDSEIRSLVDNATLRLMDDTEDVNHAIPHTLASLEIAEKKGDPQLLAQIQFRLAT